LTELNPSKIALNVDSDSAFGDGLHVGELSAIFQDISKSWLMKAINVPEQAVEYVVRRVPGQLEYYQNMQENIWAMIEEGFSERVIEPGVTTTTEKVHKRSIYAP
jgi:hypothetical protein